MYSRERERRVEWRQGGLTLPSASVGREKTRERVEGARVVNFGRNKATGILRAFSLSGEEGSR